MKKVVVLGAMLCCSVEAAQFSDRAIMNQRIGGGSPIDEPSVISLYQKSGVAWSADLSCGDMSLNAELLGAFSSGQFKQLQASLIGNLMAALNPLSLLGTAIQKANPDLYDDLMNGSIMANDSFLENFGSCQRMQESLLKQMPAGSLKQLAVSEEYADAIKKHANSNIQLSSLILKDSSGSSYDDGKKGVEFAGEKRGTASKPIKVVEHATYAGFNTLTGREPTDTTSLSSYQAHDIGFAEVFKSPKQADEFISQVVGETKLHTDNGDSPREELQGIGAKAAYIKEMKKVANDITALMGENIPMISDEYLDSISSSSILVTHDLLLAVKQIHKNERGAYINALASDIAISRTYDKLLHSVRIIDAGLRDKSVSNVDAVREEALHKRELLLQEMDLLEREMRFKKELAGDAALDIMRRANMENRAAVAHKPGTEVHVSGAN